MVTHPVAEATEKNVFGSLSPDEFYARHSVSHSSEFITNSRGMKLHTQSWNPLPPTTVIGTVAVVHGFKCSSNWLIQLTSVLLAKSGFATCAVDLPGHGLSEGLRAHIPDITPVVDDCIAVFDAFRSRHSTLLPSFLYTESLGSAIGLLITLRGGGRRWDGIVLYGAMCGISPRIKPPWPLEHLLGVVAAAFPKWKGAITRGNILELSFKEEWKRNLVLASPYCITGRPRAATAIELVRVCAELQGRFEEVDVPFLVAHGGKDWVCDPACVEDLYERAASKDKTIRIYPGMWHQLIGEPEENVELVFGDIVKWLQTRARFANKATAINGGAWL